MQFVRNVVNPTTNARVLQSRQLVREDISVRSSDLQKIQHPAQNDTPYSVSNKVYVDLLKEVIQIFNVRPSPHCLFLWVNESEARTSPVGLSTR